MRQARVAVTRLDRWIGGAALALAAFAGVLLWASQAVVAPPRPKISDSQVASLGLGLLILLVAVLYFERVERRFADVI